MKNSLKDRYEELKRFEFDRNEIKNMGLRVPIELYQVMEEMWFEERKRGYKGSLQDVVLRKFLVGAGLTYNPTNQNTKFLQIKDCTKKEED
jgi:hypothetical protein